MSADNGVYILRTPRFIGLLPSSHKQEGYEYRVDHLQAVENVYWNDKTKEQDGNNDDNAIENARRMWKDCKVFNTEGDALVEANRLYKEIMDYCGVVEYGISYIFIDREF